MKKTVKELFPDASKIKQSMSNLECVITSLCFDSRKVCKDALFFAIVGVDNDGHDFIPQAIKNGARAVVCQVWPTELYPEVLYIQVENSAKALAYAAAAFYDYPSSKLKLVGITGTNGKTTTVSLLHALFCKLGYKVGLLSTIQNKINEEIIPSTHTTPDPIELNSLLARMVNANCTHAFMEVSSHAIAQDRITALEFTGAAFSNITHDHLDYHKTFAEYIRVKKMFFDNLPKTAFAITNVDDKNGLVMLQNTVAKTYTYALKNPADFKCKIIENSVIGLHLNMDSMDVWCRLVGEFNAYNLTAIYAIAILLGEDKIEVLRLLSELVAAEGRFEVMPSARGFTAIVDYAHTPDALENVLTTIKSIKEEGQQIITVVGAGGNRDATKRPIMAKIAALHSNRLILTSDNPRFEDPQMILDQMMKGVDLIQQKKTL
ncbi:MAG: UDP-N-acetylmuramoyl-L-alanyl-D-glutamate--2,6-diaminopimelate ligase, partial [Bacteroidales bacterium]